MTASRPVSRWRKVLAWGVHFYTALGLFCAAGIALLLVEGQEESYRLAFALMFLATFIDATDGTLARLVRVKEATPGFDGRRLDDLIDFLTYVCLPLLLIWRADLLPPGHEGVLLLALLAGAYGFCQVDAKTPDGHFLGFPSYWNLVAFYLYALPLRGDTLATAIIAVLAVLTFVPSRYLYPTQRGGLNRLTNLLAVPWAMLVLVVLWRLPGTGGPSSEVVPLAAASLYFPIYYLTVSWAITLRHWQRRHSGSDEPAGQEAGRHFSSTSP